MTTETQEPTTTDDQQKTTPPSGDAGSDTGGHQDDKRIPLSAHKIQLSQKDARIAELEQKIANDNAAKVKADEEAERKRLEEDGQYKELAENEKRLREEAAASHKAEIRRLTLEAKLAGITNELAREGAIARCGPDADIEEYVAQIQKDHPELWKAPGVSGSASPPQGEQSKGGPSEDLESRLHYDDPKDSVGSAVIRANARAEKAKTGGYG